MAPNFIEKICSLNRVFLGGKYLSWHIANSHTCTAMVLATRTKLNFEQPES